MTENAPGVPLGAWLAELDDERLIRLLELRPDLTQPPPGTIAALAARAQARQSVKAATDDLDFLHLAVIDALLVLHARHDRGAAVQAAGADRRPQAPRPRVTAAVDDLRERALVWGDAAVRVTTEAATGLPWYPGPGHGRGHRRRRTSPSALPDSTRRSPTCCRSCWRARRWDAPATPLRAPRRIARCSGCWRPGCCARWTPTR